MKREDRTYPNFSKMLREHIEQHPDVEAVVMQGDNITHLRREDGQLGTGEFLVRLKMGVDFKVDVHNLTESEFRRQERKETEERRALATRVAQSIQGRAISLLTKGGLHHHAKESWGGGGWGDSRAEFRVDRKVSDAGEAWVELSFSNAIKARKDPDKPRGEIRDIVKGSAEAERAKAKTILEADGFKCKEKDFERTWQGKVDKSRPCVDLIIYPKEEKKKGDK